MENLRVQHFERILRDNPKSRAFAPLAEAYRKNGQLEKALEVALKGVEANSDYQGGKVALSRVLVDLNQIKEAKKNLEEVVKVEPDNILALRILGKVCIQLKDYQKAIEVYTCIKAFQPEDQKSEKILLGLRRSGALSEASGDDHNGERKVHTTQTPPPNANLDLEKKIAFIDALLDQSKYKKAESEIQSALQIYQGHPDLKKRLHYIKGLSQPANNIQKSMATTPYAVNMKKIKTLNLALKRIEKRLNNDPNFGL